MDVEGQTAGGSSYQNGNDNNQQQSLPGGAKIKELQNDVNQLTSVMQSNINKVLERGDRMDTLNERSELLSSRANEFRINSRNVSRKFWWQNFRFQLTIGVVVMTLISLKKLSDTPPKSIISWSLQIVDNFEQQQQQQQQQQ